jgi:hypothetical protein
MKKIASVETSNSTMHELHPIPQREHQEGARMHVLSALTLKGVHRRRRRSRGE